MILYRKKITTTVFEVTVKGKKSLKIMSQNMNFIFDSLVGVIVVVVVVYPDLL